MKPQERDKAKSALRDILSPSPGASPVLVPRSDAAAGPGKDTFQTESKELLPGPLATHNLGIPSDGSGQAPETAPAGGPIYTRTGRDMEPKTDRSPQGLPDLSDLPTRKRAGMNKSIYLYLDEIQAMEEIARKKGSNMSAVVRLAVERLLGELGKQGRR